MIELVPKFVDSPTFLYFLGSLRILIGLAIVLAHVMWIGTLGLVIYLLGWVSLLRGIAMPEPFCEVGGLSLCLIRERL